MYWEKGTIVDIDPKDNPPHHFKLVSDSTIAPKEPKETEASTVAEIERENLLLEAKSRGIKNAEILTQDELLEVLAKDTTKERIAKIVKDAKGRKEIK